MPNLIDPEISRLWPSRVEDLRLATGLDHSEWAEVLRLTPSRYAELREGSHKLELASLLSLCEYTHLGIEAFLKGKYDLKIVSERFSGQQNLLPERYQVAAFSKRRTALYFLDYIEEKHGWRWRNRVLRNLQVSESVFSEPDAPINVQFLTDMMTYLKDQRFHDREFFQVGLHSRIVNQNAPWALALGRFKDPAQAYESLILDLMSQVERNSTYEITQLHEGHCRVESRSIDAVAESLGVKYIGSYEGCRQRAGALACVPGYLHLPYAHVQETLCQHRGDTVCRFEVDFTLALRALRSRGKSATTH